MGCVRLGQYFLLHMEIRTKYHIPVVLHQPTVKVHSIYSFLAEKERRASAAKRGSPVPPRVCCRHQGSCEHVPTMSHIHATCHHMLSSSGDLVIPNDTRLVARLRVLHGLDKLAKRRFYALALLVQHLDEIVVASV